MKILHTSANGFTIRTLLTPQIDYFTERGFLVESTCSPGEEVEQLQKRGYVLHPISVDRRFLSSGNLAAIIQLTQLMRKHRYDLVHVHTPFASVLGRIAAKLAGVQRVVYTAHGLPFHDQSPKYNYWLFFAIEKFCASFTDLILVQNYEDLKVAQERGLCAKHQVRYLGNGVDLNRFSRSQLEQSTQAQLRRSLGIPTSAKIMIGTIGRLTQKKGAGVLVEAIARLLPEFPHLHLLIIGGQIKGDPHPFQAQLIQQIRTLKLENSVTLVGDRADTPELLGLLDIFVLPTFTHEGLPRSILEAMAMELPVVATNIRGCREAVIPGKTGLIVPPKNANELANALRLLILDQGLRKKYGKAGRQRVETEYDERFVFRRLADSYAELGIQPAALSDEGRSQTRSITELVDC